MARSSRTSGRRFVAAKVEGRRVTAVEAKGTDGAIVRVRAKVFIDATGNVDLCRAAGCETMLALGHAAGLAAAQAVQTNLPVAKIDVGSLRSELRLAPFNG